VILVVAGMALGDDKGSGISSSGLGGPAGTALPTPGNLPGSTSGPGGSSGGGGSGPTRGSVPTPTPPDPTEAHFRSIVAGTCLDASYDGSEFAPELPETVSCRADDATLYVESVGTSHSGCPTSYDRGSWGETGGRVLCVRRLFHVGDCFPASYTGSWKEDNLKVNANVFITWPCGADKVPLEYNSIMRVTGVYQAPSGRPDCGYPRFAWLTNDDEEVVCAEFVPA
jgi:hypothetical protein